MINLTDSALNAVRSAIATAAQPVDGLRIMVDAPASNTIWVSSTRLTPTTP
jgi:Fe-S cluster assembly iron-binding protein IscA